MDLAQQVTVKLGVVNDKGIKLFRRVDLTRHAVPNETGMAVLARFYTVLKLYAIQSATGAHELPTEAALKTHSVTLHYTDTDGDEIIIGSSEELREALQIHMSKGVVKIMAIVEGRPELSIAASTVTMPEGVSVETQTNERNPAALNVVHSILGALGPAVMAVHGSVQEARSRAAAVQPEVAARSVPSPTVAQVPPPEEKPEEPKEEEKKEEPKEGEKKPDPEPTAGAAKPEQTVEETVEAAVKTVEAVVKESLKTAAAVAAAVKEEAKPEAKPEERPFIHGRHTCDGCLTTPIVGKRFHATNLPDYDLCEPCKNNYKGDQVQFVETQLDRDVAFQERWHRRRAKWANGRQHNRNCRKNRGAGRRTPGFSPPAPHAGPSPDQVDNALKEAIRRSLVDYKKKPEKKEDKKEEKSETVDTTASETDATPVTPEAPAFPAAPAPDVQQVVRVADVEDKKPAAEEKPTARPQPVVECKPETAVAGEAAPAEPEIQVAPMEAAAPVVEEAKPVEETPKTEEKSVASKETSFGDDAQGMGGIAQQLGDTLDQIAQGIDAFTEELNRDTSAVEDEEAMTEEDEPKDAGVTIVDENKDDDESSQGSWNVVMDPSFASTSNEALAHAAQVIGSSLLQSDIANSAGDVSALSRCASDSSESTTFSSVGSVPTTVHSIGTATLAQTERWAAQLNQLRELGFEDDNKMVETMERLQAANIGVNSTDEVSVEQVLDALMK